MDNDFTGEVFDEGDKEGKVFIMRKHAEWLARMSPRVLCRGETQRTAERAEEGIAERPGAQR